MMEHIEGVLELYRALECENPGCLLLMRIGDDYTVFGDGVADAIRVLDLERYATRSGGVPTAWCGANEVGRVIDRAVAGGIGVAVAECGMRPGDRYRVTRVIRAGDSR